MQELIDKIQYSIDIQSEVSLTETQVNTLKAVMLISENLLEKEKEQIIEAYRYGHIDGFTSANHLGTEFENEEEYYNQILNQNK